MAILAAKFRVKNKGIFDLKGLYEYLHLWVCEEGFGPFDDKEFPEVFHGQTEFPDGSKELWIWWRCRKIPDNNSYYCYELDIDWHSVPFKNTEIVYQGKKVKVVQGDLEINVEVRIVPDYKGTWSKHWLLKHFKNFYWKVIHKSDFELRKKDMREFAYRLQETIKDFWELQPGAEEPEHEGNFWPQEGIGE